MPIPSLVYRIFVASPSDCLAERKLIREVATEWNAIHSVAERAILEPVFWESHSRPELGDRGQAIINRQLVADCDIGIGVFWTKLGSPTGDSESGTVEEIEELRKAGRPVLLYFSAVPVAMDSVDAKEYQRLKKFRERMKEEGLYFQYGELAEFRRLVQRHLSQQVAALLQLARADGLQEPYAEHNAVSGTGHHLPFAAALNEFQVALRTFAAEWRAERDSEPYNLDEGKLLLAGLAKEVSRLRSVLDNDSSDSARTLDEVSTNLRKLQRHELVLDGGTSYAEFWKAGDEALTTLTSIPPMIVAEATR